MPADRPVVEADRAAAPALIAAWLGEYQSNLWGSAVRVDQRWAALAGALGIPVGAATQMQSSPATVFCHERRTPDGRRWLVVAEWGFSWQLTVIDRAVWPIGDGPRMLRREAVVWDGASADAIHATHALPGPTRFGAGVPDPADSTRFTLPFVYYGVPGTWEYRLGDDDRVMVCLLDPEGFTARAKAAKAWAATQPAR
jgi:hypothetical protein